MRLVETLPADDSIRITACKGIDEGIVAFEAATKAVSEARAAESLAATRLWSVTDAWERQMEKVFGALEAEVGRAQAECFFPPFWIR